ncbi:MAG: hypothetical protein GX102_04645 [Porphyromonadaceae bacterium]|jgi:hypothetical protein|nr:hypothetical protein [Porphyromonadaceae bacterium]
MSVLTNLYFESEAITEQPVEIAFKFDNKENVPKGKELGDKIVIKPATVRTWFRMKPLLMSIDREDYNKLLPQPPSETPFMEGEIPDSELIAIVAKYDELLMEIIFLGIHNKKGDMPDWFKEVLRDNCNWRDIRILFNAIVFRLGVQSFCKSITTAASVSPMTEAEIIAAQKNLESWTNL